MEAMSSEGAGTGEDVALCIESPKVSVWKRGGHVVIAIMALSVALIAVGLPVPYVLVGGLVIELWRRTHAKRSARARPARVRVGDFLEIAGEGRRFYARTADITDCWERPHPDSAVVDVYAATARALIAIRVPDRASADTLGRALGADATTHLVGTTLSAAPTLAELPWRRKLPGLALTAAVYLGWGAVLSIALVGPLRQEILPILIMIASLMIMVQAVKSLFRINQKVRVFVGRDGLLLTLRDRREFIGFERVREIRDGIHGILVKLTTGEEISLPLAVPMGGLFTTKPHPLDSWFRDIDHVLARRRALAAQLKQALQRFRDAGDDASAVTAARLLDRGSRSFSEWRGALTHEQADTYRERQLDTDQLAKVVENPRIPLGQRLGAALALSDRAAGQPQTVAHRARIRTVIESSASPRVRIALEQASEGKLSDADYQQALEAEAEAERDARKARRFF